MRQRFPQNGNLKSHFQVAKDRKPTKQAAHVVEIFTLLEYISVMSNVPQKPIEKDIPTPTVPGRYGVGLFG
jgi:hypothetical protein